MLLKGHWEETVQRFVGPYAQRNRLIAVIVAEAKPEEITDGRLDARIALAVPVGPQDERLQMPWILARDGEPDVRDDAGAGFVENGQRLAGSDLARVGVGSGTVVAGGALLDIVFGLRKVCEPGLEILGEGSARECNQHHDDARVFHVVSWGGILLRRKRNSAWALFFATVAASIGCGKTPVAKPSASEKFESKSPLQASIARSQAVLRPTPFAIFQARRLLVQSFRETAVGCARRFGGSAR